MNENNANWHIIPGNLSFFPFSAFPRTGPSMSLANILRHLWELSHGDSLSPLGALWSAGWLLCQLLRPRGANREGFFSPTARKTMTQYHSDPDELFLPDGAVSPRNTHLPRHYTRTQASLWRWESSSYCVTQSQARGRLKNVLTSRVTPSVSQKPGGLQGTLLSCDCAFFGRWSPSNAQGGFSIGSFISLMHSSFWLRSGEVVLSSYVPL